MPPTRVPADAAEPVPVYDFPEDAARALAHHYAWLTRATGRVPELPDVRRDEAAGLLAAALAAGPDPRWLAPEEIGRLFDCYGLPLSTVERTVGGGVAELLVGVVHDPLFGPVLACLVGGPARRAALGRGGADHPLTDADAADMVRSLAAFPLQAGIIGEAAVDPVRKERVLRSFARAIHDLTDYIPGPDMGTDETCMAWIHDEIGRAVGLPAVLGGIPLDQIGATGFGLAVCADAVEAAGHLRISGARVAIQGFGAVGRHTARFLAQRGARIVGVSDRGGAVVDGHGLDVERLLAFKAAGRSVGTFPGAAGIPRDDLIRLDCDILVPAARPDVLTADNAHDVKAKLVLQGANIPATREAEEILHKRGVLCVPDFVANAGGVICAAAEYRRGTRAQALSLIEERIRANTLEVLTRVREQDVLPREAAETLAWERVQEARSYRRYPWPRTRATTGGYRNGDQSGGP